jgi:tetratricopeptide (TPR) repeat protein
MEDYYKLLGVAPSASAVDVRKAYAQLARDKHPDRFTDPKQKERAQAEFRDITTAFNALMNPERALPLVEAGQLEEAVTLLRTAVHHAPGKAAYQAALGHALALIPAAAREAVQALEKASQLDPKNVAIHADLAAVLARQGLRLRAQKVLEAAQRLAPRDARLARLAAELGLGRQ